MLLVSTFQKAFSRKEQFEIDTKGPFFAPKRPCMSQMGEKLAEGIVQRGFWCLESLLVKSIYCEKATRFEKISHFLFSEITYSNVKTKLEIFFKFVWPSENIWTLYM